MVRLWRHGARLDPDLATRLRQKQIIGPDELPRNPRVHPRARLEAADLKGADLRWADLTRARLRGADLRGADLSHADLSFADLEGADLRGARLDRTRLVDTMLTGADLSDVDLSTTTGLTAGCLKGARSTRATRWPRGFDPHGEHLAGPVFSHLDRFGA